MTRLERLNPRRRLAAAGSALARLATAIGREIGALELGTALVAAGVYLVGSDRMSHGAAAGFALIVWGGLSLVIKLLDIHFKPPGKTR